MSIINDALKKTQLNFKKKDVPPASAKEQKKQEKPEEKNLTDVYKKLYQKKEEQQTLVGSGNVPRGKESAKKKGSLRPARKWLQTVITLVVFLAFVSGGIYFGMRLEPVQNFIRSVRNKNVPESRSYIVNHMPVKPRSYRPGELVLNGTSLIDGKRVALINDEIYEIGEVIDGKTITSIELNQIELADNEKIITLRVH